MDPITYSNMPVVSTDECTTVAGQVFEHSAYDVTLTLTPKVFTEGYFRWAESPVDQHTGAVEYFHTEPPTADLTGQWVRCTVTDV